MDREFQINMLKNLINEALEVAKRDEMVKNSPVVYKLEEMKRIADSIKYDQILNEKN